MTLEKGPVYELHVVDDGQGFNAAASGVEEGHVGLAIMRERAQRIGGRVTVDSGIAGGTRITLTLPIVRQEAA